MTAPEIFCETSRQLKRKRMRACPDEDRWLLARVCAELLDRWTDHEVTAERVLILGDDADQIAPSLSARGIVCLRADVAGDWADIHCAEDQLPFGDQVFDAVFACMTLDSVNDLPGALVLIRRALTPKGLMLGVFLGGGTGLALRTAIFEEQGDQNQRIARAHPLIDVRAAGDLLARAGFVDPVADTEAITVRYRSLESALADRRANGLGNMLRERRPMSKSEFKRLENRLFSDQDGKSGYLEEFHPVYLTGRK